MVERAPDEVREAPGAARAPAVDLRLDVIGDVHGQLVCLEALGRELGYRVDQDWSHPDDRVLVFVGDLIDRGPHSLETAELVRELTLRDQAVCLMGNHEYNLIAHRRGLSAPKQSNRSTIRDVAARPGRWSPVLDFLEGLPVALDMNGLRVIHAVWHRRCFVRARAAIGERPDARPLTSQAHAVRAHVVLGSPFRGGALVEALGERGTPEASDNVVEVLLKGFETPADAPFVDSEGRERDAIRVCWWDGPHPAVDAATLTVVGHYWNVPPVGDAPSFTPPFPSGHPKLRAWAKRAARTAARRGRLPVPMDVGAVCIDYSGVTKAGAGPCVGAFRWPEREVAWVRLDV